MRADVTLLDLRLRRRPLLGFTAGMALYALVVVALYPQFKNSLSLNQLTKHGSAVAALFGATGTPDLTRRLAQRQHLR
jgi:ABC-2 type transport system permease protein